MTFFTEDGPVAGRQAILAPGAARTTGGGGPAIHMKDRDTLRLTLDVSAAAGTTPSLAVTLEHSSDGETWTTHSTFAAKTGVGSERKVFAGIDQWARVTWTITGTTPSFTFSVEGAAV